MNGNICKKCGFIAVTAVLMTGILVPETACEECKKQYAPHIHESSPVILTNVNVSGFNSSVSASASPSPEFRI